MWFINSPYLSAAFTDLHVEVPPNVHSDLRVSTQLCDTLLELRSAEMSDRGPAYTITCR